MINSFSKRKPTKEEIAETIEYIAILGLMDEAETKTRQDICRNCIDRRCESGRICREFLRRSKSYAWEIMARDAELN